MVKGLPCAGSVWPESAGFPCIDLRKFATAAAASFGGRAALRTRESAVARHNEFVAHMGTEDMAMDDASGTKPQQIR